MAYYALDDREHATVLAALRYWQREGVTSSGHEIADIATNSGSVEALDAAEIDGLCERLNTQDDDEALPEALHALEDIEGSALTDDGAEQARRIATAVLDKHGRVA